MPDKVKEATQKIWNTSLKIHKFCSSCKSTTFLRIKKLARAWEKTSLWKLYEKKKKRKAQNVETKRTQMEEWFRPCVRRKHYYIYFTHHVFIITQKPWQQRRAYERYASLRNGRTSCMVAFFLSFWIAAENSCLKDFLKKKKEGGQQKIWTLN